MSAVEINVMGSSPFENDARELFSLVDGKDLCWSLLFFYGHGNRGLEFDLEEIEERARTSSRGVLMSWEKVLHLIGNVEQTIDCLLIGAKDETKLQKYTSREQMIESCSVVIELIDGGIWELYMKDPAQLQIIIDHFQQKNDVQLRPL